MNLSIILPFQKLIDIETLTDFKYLDQMNENRINEIFFRLFENNKNPKGELNYTNDFTLLVAVILSAQATDISVNKATEELFKVADTPEKMISLGEGKLKKYIKTLNYYNTKAKHLIQTAKILKDEFNSKVPETRDELMQLPGVGRKTANVVLNIAFGKPTIAVDTHILRVSNRLGLSNGKKPETIENDLLKIVPEKYIQNAHHLLLLFGRYTCKARNPKCENCFLLDICEYNKTKI